MASSGSTDQADLLCVKIIKIIFRVLIYTLLLTKSASTPTCFGVLFSFIQEIRYRSNVVVVVVAAAP